jgi:putative oxidoreductase
VKQAIASWESQARSVMRVIAGYMIILHGLRETVHWLPPRGRGPGSFMALDPLGTVGGTILLIAGALLVVGLFTRPAAAVLAIQSVVAYFYAAAPRGIWPIRNGGNETLTYPFVFLYLAAVGGGIWSLDAVMKRGKGVTASPAEAV